MKQILAAALLAMTAFTCGGRVAAAPLVPAPSVFSYGAATIIEQDDPTSGLVGTEFFISAGLDRQTQRESGVAALVAEAILRTPVALDGAAPIPLRVAVADAGGSIAYGVSGHDVHFYLEGRKQVYATTLLPMFRSALSKPQFGESMLASARASLERRFAALERVPLTAGIEMLDRSFYSRSNAGLPEFGMPATVARLTSADARKFYAAYYRRNGAVASAVGDTSTLALADLERVIDALPPGTSRPVRVSTLPLAGHTRELRAERNISVPWLVAQYRAPQADSPDFGAMLVLTAFIGHTLSDVAELPSIATRPFAMRGVGALYNFDARPANVIVYVDGGLGHPSRTFSTALSVVDLLGHTKLHGRIADLKSMAEGDFINGAVTLEDRAWLAGVFALQHGSPDYLNRAVAAIEAVTPADLQRVAHRYLGSPTVAVILPRAAVPHGI